MHQVSVGAESKPGEGFLTIAPTLSNGVMAAHLPGFLANYRRPLPAARQDIALAKAAGIDTFGCLLFNGHLPNSQYASMIHALFDAAAEDGAFKVEPDIWGTLKTPRDIDTLAAALGMLKDRHDNAWRRYKGRRVVTLWTDNGHLTDAQRKPLPYRETVDALFARIGGREAVFLTLYSPAELKRNNPDWFAGADAFAEWLSMDYGFSIQARTNAAAMVKAAGKEFWYPVMPSFAQSRGWPPGFYPNVREKLGMVNFLDDWQAAIEADAPAVMIATWNDLTEDSAIMPESNHGAVYQVLNAWCARRFQTGQSPAVDKEQVLLFHHPQVVEGLRLPAGREPMAAFPWARTTPPTDYVGVVGLLKEPARVVVQFGEQVMGEKTLPAGMTAWLLYHPQPKQGGRHAEDPPVYPVERSGLVLTVLDKPFRETQVCVFVYRGAERLGVFRSHRPIVAAAGRGEMQTVGDVFDLRPVTGTQP